MSMLTHISFTPLILGILCLGLIYTICLSLFQYWRLRHIPGPKLAWTNLWLMWHMNSEEPFHNTKKRLNDRYGPVQRYGPNRVMFSGLSAVSVILGTSNILPKASNHEPLKTYINGSEIASFIALTDDTKASQLKKHLHATFTPNGVLNYETHVDDTVTELLSHLHGLSSASPTAKTTDLADWMSWFAFDTITRIGLSENQGFMRKQMDVDGVGASAAKRFAHWNFYWTIPWLEALIYKNAYTRNKKTPPRAGLFALAVRVVEQRIQQQRQTEKTSLQDEEKQQQQQQTKDLLSLYMDAAIQSPNLYTKQTIIAMTITTIQAGAETTAYTTSILLYLLLTHPQVLTTLRKELSTLQSSPTRCILPMSALRKLPYLDACIKESMRLKPAVNIVTERVTTHYIPDLGGVAIPAGTIVAVNNAGIYSDCEIWGEDVGVFRPERWIGEDVGEESKIVMQKAFLGFSKGARMCLGINVAGMEIRKVVAGLVMEFDFELVHPNRHLNLSPGIFAVPSGIDVRIHPRNKTSSPL